MWIATAVRVAARWKGDQRQQTAKVKEVCKRRQFQVPYPSGS
jgi:hypothetical protein